MDIIGTQDKIYISIFGTLSGVITRLATIYIHKLITISKNVELEASVILVVLADTAACIIHCTSTVSIINTITIVANIITLESILKVEIPFIALLFKLKFGE